VVPDAVEVAARVYKVAVESEQVRVLLADYAPGSKVPLHRHPDHVVFALEGGAAVFQKAGTHEVDGARPTATRAILVELGAKRGSAVPAGDEPVAKHPRMFKLLVDEARIRVLDVTFGKGRSRPVALGDHVLLSRDKGMLVVEPRGGSAQALELDPGEVVFLPAGVYTATNSKRESFEVVLFELKP
jgi:quercetin dioxygenase-like cupin family protein